jgi:hypothetical protein
MTTRAKLVDTAKWAGRRLLTVGLYILAIIGATSWDRDPNSWFLICLRLGATAMFLWWAVWRTIDHWHLDQEDA